MSSKSKDRAVPRIVCVAIPIKRTTSQVLLVTSRKHQDSWIRAWTVLRGLSIHTDLLSLPPKSITITITATRMKYRKEGMNRVMENMMPLHRGKLWKKVETFAPLPVPPPLTHCIIALPRYAGYYRRCPPDDVISARIVTF